MDRTEELDEATNAVVQGTPLGLELDLSASKGACETSGRLEEGLRHFLAV